MDQREEDLIEHSEESARQAGSVAERPDREDGISAAEIGGETSGREMGTEEQHDETTQDQVNEAFAHTGPAEGQPEDASSQLGGETASQAEEGKS